jgi:putative ATPase
MNDLFSTAPDAVAAPDAADDHRPLAEQIRPHTLDAVHGQSHLTAPSGIIGRMVASRRPSSMILWGPPGSGKTTIATMMANLFDMRYIKISAIHSGVADLKKAFAEADAALAARRRTLLFVDEIHRFNRAQQDSFLPYVENGTVVLVGATTENPSFQLNGAILSRCLVLTLHVLDEKALLGILARAENEIGPLRLTPAARSALVASAGGDARHMLNQAEILLNLAGDEDLDVEGMEAILSRRMASHDRSGDSHYNYASALQKSIRGSDPDAALYYAACMLDAGEDVSFLLRRLEVIASEDIGMADPTALLAAVAARQAYSALGAPEGEYAIAQAVVHLACAPKSNATYLAWKAARDLAARTRGISPPKRILNAPTEMMRRQGYKEGYEYPHDWPRAFTAQDYWPDEMPRQRLYLPTDRGQEARIGERVSHWHTLREERSLADGQR